MGVKLESVVPWGRSKKEYELMFRLTDQDLSKRILDCGSGPASFNSEMTAAGYSVLSIDPIYEFSGEQIKDRFEQCADKIISQVDTSPDKWVWKFHEDSKDLLANRRRATEIFITDYDKGKKERRYQTALLPQLSFRDEEFDLALCSHFLFLYSEHLNEEFHLQSVKELCRVANEVRIFPLLDTASHQKSPHIQPVQKMLIESGVGCEIETVKYEFQKGGNQMMRIFRK